MKNLLNTSKRTFMNTALAVLILLLFALPAKLYSQISVDDITGSVKVELKKKAIENLKAAILSDNPGVRKSAIYHAGYYRVKETVSSLMKQLKREEDPSIRILIALSLYKLNDEKALNLIKELSYSDSDPKVRRMCSAIFNEYEINRKSVAKR